MVKSNRLHYNTQDSAKNFIFEKFVRQSWQIFAAIGQMRDNISESFHQVFFQGFFSKSQKHMVLAAENSLTHLYELYNV